MIAGLLMMLATIAATCEGDPLGGLWGIDGSHVVIAGTVRSVEKEDHATVYLVEPTSLIADLQAEDGQKAVDLVDATMERGDQIRLTRHGSDFETGKSYAFFFQHVPDTEPPVNIVRFVHDLDSDKPAGQFNSRSTRSLIKKVREASEPERSGSDLDVLVELARVLQDPGEFDHPMLVALYGANSWRTSEPTTTLPLHYPLLPEQMVDGEADVLSRVTMLMLVDDNIHQVAAKGGGRVLGWFPVQEGGYAIGDGFVDKSQDFHVVHKGAMGAQRHVPPLPFVNPTTMTFEIPAGDRSYIFIDIRSKGDRESSYVTADAARYAATLERYRDVLDG